MGGIWGPISVYSQGDRVDFPAFCKGMQTGETGPGPFLGLLSAHQTGRPDWVSVVGIVSRHFVKDKSQ